jgi:hypothetical protein
MGNDVKKITLPQYQSESFNSSVYGKFDSFQWRAIDSPFQCCYVNCVDFVTGKNKWGLICFSFHWQKLNAV